MSDDAYHAVPLGEGREPAGLRGPVERALEVAVPQLLVQLEQIVVAQAALVVGPIEPLQPEPA